MKDSGKEDSGDLLTGLTQGLTGAFKADLEKQRGQLGILKGREEKKSSVDQSTKQDLEKLIQTLESTNERKKLVKTLKSLLAAQKAEEPQETFLDKMSMVVSAIVESSAEAIISAAGAIARFPSEVSKIVMNAFQEEHQKNLKMLLWHFSLALLTGIGCEFIARMIMNFSLGHTRLTYTWAVLGLRFIQRIIPLIIFGIASHVMVLVYKPSELSVEQNIQSIITSILIIRTILMTMYILIEPKHPDLRIFDVKSSAARTLYRFALALGQIVLGGVIFAFLGLQLGISSQAFVLWQKVVGLGVLILLITGILEAKQPVIRWLRREEGGLHAIPRIFSSLIIAATRQWHKLLILILVMSYLLWVFGSPRKAFLLLKASFLSVILMIGFLWMRRKLEFWWSKIEIQEPEEEVHWLKSTYTQLHPTLQKISRFILTTLFFILFLDAWGISVVQIATSKFVQPYFLTVLSVALILLLSRLVWSIVDFVVETQVSPKVVEGMTIEPTVFAKTVAPIVRSVLRWIIIILTLIFVLEELGIPVMPILYGISVIGIAISLGAQSLVKDLINGVLTLMEGNMAVGDVVTIGQFTGVVESITLRGLSLRHGNGALQTIPFSEVTNIINKSRDYTIVPIEISVPHGANIGQVYEAIAKAGEEIAKDKIFKKRILEPIQITGIDKFTDTAVTVSAFIKTLPDPKNQIGREFNKRLKAYLDQLGVSLSKAQSAPPVG